MQREEKYNSTDINKYLQQSLLNINPSEINPTNISALSLNGGGRKGLIYSGMLKALEQTNLPNSKKNVLSQINHLTGSSAGAITASFLAVEATSEELSAITSVPFTAFTDPTIKFKSDSTTLKTFLNIIYLRKLWSKNPNNEKVRTIFNEKVRTIFSENRNFFKPANLIQLVTAIKDKPKSFSNLPTFNFEDLKQVSNRTLDITVTDTNTSSTIIYNENSPETPLAKAVMLSASHPVLFKQEKGFTDGGASDNMPLIPLIKRGLSLPNIITVSLNEGDAKKINHLKLHKQQSHLSAPLQRFAVGANVTKALEQSSKTKGVTSAIGNNLDLFSGKIKTTTMKVNPKELANSNIDSYNATKQFLEQRFSNHSERTELLFNLDNVSQNIIKIIKLSSTHEKLRQNTSISPEIISKNFNETKNLIKEQLTSIIRKTSDEDYNISKLDKKTQAASTSSPSETESPIYDYYFNDEFSTDDPILSDYSDFPSESRPQRSINIEAEPVDSTPQRRRTVETKKEQHKQYDDENDDNDDYYFEGFNDSPPSEYSASPVEAENLIDIHSQMLSMPQRRSNIEQEKNQTIDEIFDIIRNLANIDNIISKEEVLNIKEEMDRGPSNDNGSNSQYRF